MTNGINPAAPEHLPVFITAPGEPDTFLIGCAIFLVLAILGLGSLYFRLHALPEHLAHGNANKLQFEVVAVLALLALFTHNNGFWVAALLLALVPIPDIYAPLAGMAESLAKMAGWRRSAPRIDAPPTVVPEELALRIPPKTGNSRPAPTGASGDGLNDATHQTSGNREQTGSAAGNRPHPERKERLES